MTVNRGPEPDDVAGWTGSPVVHSTTLDRVLGGSGNADDDAELLEYSVGSADGKA